MPELHCKASALNLLGYHQVCAVSVIPGCSTLSFAISPTPSSSRRKIGSAVNGFLSLCGSLSIEVEAAGGPRTLHVFVKRAIRTWPAGSTPSPGRRCTT